jgi:predicted transposase YdaD
MATLADTSGKKVISLIPEQWAHWVTGLDLEDFTDCAVLSGDFQVLERSTDALLRVTHPVTGVFLILFEFQLHYRKAMPVRIAAYSAMAEEKYGLRVYPVLLNLLPYGQEIPTRYESNLLGLYARRDYLVINLWELPAEDALEQLPATLWSLVPFMGGGDNEALVFRAEAQIANDAELRTKDLVEDTLAALQMFASFIYDEEFLFRQLGADMEAIRRTPFYREVWHQAQQEGITLGRQEMLQGFIARRFGDAGELRERVAGLSPEQARQLIDEMIFNAQINSREELSAWLDSRETVH